MKSYLDIYINMKKYNFSKKTINRSKSNEKNLL